MSFEIDAAGLDYDGVAALDGVCARFEKGRLSAIAGPNGAGKSTLLGIMAGLRARYRGSCRYQGREVRAWGRREFARRVGFVPQALRIEFPFTVEQVVMMGRTPFANGWFEAPGDREAVERALQLTDTLAFRNRDFRSLSGGERQRAVLASALAQSPEFLLLDEPTTFLDLKHQIAIYRLLAELCAAGLGVVTVTHDLNLALTYSDDVVVLDRGRVAASGPTREVLTPALLSSTFAIHATVENNWIRYAR